MTMSLLRHSSNYGGGGQERVFKRPKKVNQTQTQEIGTKAVEPVDLYYADHKHDN